MPGLQADDEQKEEKLKAALWYSTGQTVDAVAVSQDLNATPHFIGGLTKDLEAFAKHGGRSTINAKDVLLLGRRNDGLKAVLEAEAKEVKKMNAR
ncbi:MHF histone-fold complex component [Elasticomyces elasticus]|nr:MHF histone-fold complex component [Elasticomyces elasticus]